MERQVTPFTDAWWNGPFFYPAQSTLAFSDHRVGLGLIATPLIWGGASPLAASNVALLLSFFLSAAAAYALALSLTGHRGAAFVGGLVFGFHPFRAEHVAHLELVSSVLACRRSAGAASVDGDRSNAWLVVASTALTLQGLTCGYYLFYSGVLIAGWLVWFASRGVSAAQYRRLAVALTAPLAVLSPVLLRYRDTHVALGLTRTIDEIEQFSADLIGLVTAPEPLAFWNTPEAWQRPEGALFPGVTALAVVVVACLCQGGPLPADRWRRLRTIGAAVALIAIAVAMVPALWGPVAVHLAGVRISVSGAYKPLSIAVVFAAAWLLTTAPGAPRLDHPIAVGVLRPRHAGVVGVRPGAHGTIVRGAGDLQGAVRVADDAPRLLGRIQGAGALCDAGGPHPERRGGIGVREDPRRAEPTPAGGSRRRAVRRRLRGRVDRPVSAGRAAASACAAAGVAHRRGDRRTPVWHLRRRGGHVHAHLARAPDRQRPERILCASLRGDACGLARRRRRRAGTAGDNA